MASEPGIVNFPAMRDDVISLVEANNHASATLTGAITNSQLTIPVSQPSEFSASGYATILDTLINPTTIEIVKYTSKSGSDLIVPAGGRGQQGTSAAAFSSAAPVEQRPTARHHTVLADAIIAMENAVHTCLYTNRAVTGSISNTTVETSIFSILTAGTGASRTIKANSSLSGTKFSIHAYGLISVTGTPTLQIRLKVGTTLVADTGATAIVNNSNNRFWLTADTQILTLAGAATPQNSFVKLTYPSGSPAVETILGGGSGAVNIDVTADKDFDLTFQWGTASSSNSITPISLSIERKR
jgi:hypothetical protein